MVLTRSYFLLLFGAAVTVAYLIRYRVSLRTLGLIALTGAIALSAETLHRVSLYRRHGDAFWDSTLDVRWYANV